MHDNSNMSGTQGRGNIGQNHRTVSLRFLGYGLVLMGLVVIMGWAGHEPTLTQLATGFPGLPYSTAIGFVLTGLALITVQAQCHMDHAALATMSGSSPSADRTQARVAILSGLLVLLGLLALLEWYAGLRLGLSPDSVTTRQWAGGDSALYRMHPLAAFGFIAIGLMIASQSTIRNPFVVESFSWLRLACHFLRLSGGHRRLGQI